MVHGGRRALCEAVGKGRKGFCMLEGAGEMR